MNQDKALRKTLLNSQDSLPYGFDSHLMQRIMLIAQRRARRRYAMNLALAGFVSAVMVTAAFVALNHFYTFNILHIFSGIRLTFTPLVGYCFFISFMCLLLLGIDFWVRRRFLKKA